MSAIMKKKIILSSVLAVICGACLSFAGAAFAARASAASAAPEYAYEYPQVGELTLPSVLSDGMVLQQKENVHVWGLTVGGREVTASLALASAPDTVIAQGSSIAGENGRFDIEFDGRDASFDEYVVTVGDGSTTIHIEDVLFGEVWLTGGQSNMELQLQYVIDGPELIRAARGDDRYANLRLFLEPTMPEGKDLNSQFEYLPQFDIKGARWGRANVKDDVKIVSAVSYACARKMFEELNAEAQVPVAIINTAVGATSIEAWMSRTSIENTPEVVNWIKNIKKNYVSWENWTDSRPEKFNQMTAMFNEKIAPIAGFNVKGLLWYQGENNMGDQESADFYSKALPAMVKDWSVNWWKDEKPFYCAYFHINQKEDNYTAESIPLFLEGLSTAWSENRDNLMQVPIYDIPLTWNYGSFQYKATAHPLVKIPVGERAARIVLGKVYKMYENYLPATYLGKEAKNGSVYVEFENTAGKLYAKDGAPLRGFAICGEDRLYVPAEAEIVDGKTVRVWSEDVKNPVDVTYAFTCFNYSSNLYNGIDLPVIPFRSARNAADIYYHAKDWMFADAIEMWRDDGQSVDNESAGAGAVRTVWQANPIGSGFGSTLTLEEGKAGNAVRFGYGRGGTFGFGVTGPANRNTKNHLNNMIFGQFEKYNGLELNIKNNDARAKTISVAVRTSDGKEYLLPFAENFETAAVLLPSAEYQKFLAALNCAVGADGRIIYDTEDIMLNITALEIRVSDTAAGSVSADELKLRTVGAADLSRRIVDNFAADGNYTGGGERTVVSGIDGAVGRTVLTLGKEGTASAEYDVNGALRAQVNLLARGGTFAVLTDGGLAPFTGTEAVLADIVPTYIGSDGFKYAQSDGVWYRYSAGSGSYRPLSGENAVFPKIELPDELTPSIGAEVFRNGDWQAVGAEVVSVDVFGNYTEESYAFELPQGSEKLRVNFTAAWREQAADGGSGMAADRGRSVMLSAVALFSTETAADGKPQIVIGTDKAEYTVGDRVTLHIAAYDDLTFAKDLEVKVILIEGGKRTELDSASFVIGGACTIEVSAKDGAGQEQTAALDLTAKAAVPSEGGNSEKDGNLGLILGITIPAAAIVIGAAAFFAVKKIKGGKKA